MKFIIPTRSFFPFVEFKIVSENGLERVKFKCASNVEGLAGLLLNFDKEHGVLDIDDGTNIIFSPDATGVSSLGKAAVEGEWTINLSGSQIQAYTGGKNYTIN